MSEKIPKGWKWVKLREVGIVITGKTPSSKHPEDWGYDMPFVTPTDFKNYRKFTYDSERYLSSVGINKLKNKVLPEDSILVTCIGYIGKVVMNKVPVVTNQQINSIIPDRNIVFPDFLYYVLVFNYEIFRSFESNGTAVPILNKTDFENIEVSLPPLPEQKVIAEVLSSIDDKIDLLHRQNKTLEEMAMTLFRQWFMGDNISNDTIELGSLVDIISGVSYKSTDLNPSTTAMVSLKCFDRNGGFRIDGFKEFTGNYKEQHIVKEGDLIVAHTDITQDAEVIGNPAIVISNPKYTKMVISMDIVKVIPKVNWISIEFLYFLMRTREFKGHCEGSANGSTVLHLSKQAIPTFEFKTPKREMVIEFTKQAKELLNKTFLNQRQILTLIHLRDTLLPKLMSGEVRIMK